jgi:beta-lactamase regulating signal transducer with metallopeptidase domain
MWRIGRSFVVLIVAGLTLEVGGLVVAGFGVLTVVRCYWAFLPRSLRMPAVCNFPVPMVGYHLFVPAAVVGAIIMGSIVVGVIYALHLARGSSRVRRKLGPQVEAAPGKLKMAAAAAGVTAVELHEHTVQYAACVGTWHPVVVISTSLVELLDEDELTAVLAHEDRHRRRHAPLRQLVARVSARALFFLPVVNDLLDRHLLDEELLADEEACQSAGRRPLVSALSKIAGMGVDGPLISALNPENSLLQRLDVLSGRRAFRRLHPARIAMSILCGATLVALVLWMPLAGYR